MTTPDASNTQASQQAANAPGAAPNTDATAAAPAAAAAASSKLATTKVASKADKKKTSAAAGAEPGQPDKPDPNPQTVEIWPLRSYQDAGEIKRRGGPSYSVPKRHADALIARGLATDEQPALAKATK